MSKAKHDKKTTAIVSDKEYKIVSAAIKDDYCNYAFDVLQGAGVGDNHKVTGKGIILPDLKDAFQKLNVHMAAVDDVFKHSDVDVKSIDKMRNHELSALYQCDGFKLKGTDENKKVILKGTKFVSVGGQIALESPEILLEKMSSYTWHKELLAALEGAVAEVEMYKEGKCIEVSPEDFDNSEQTSLMNEEQFDNGKVE